MLDSRAMRPRHVLCLRVAAGLALVGAGSLAPACVVSDLVSSGENCSTACNALNKCGLIQTSDCGAYCAGLESSALIMGCSDQFAAQNSCGAANTQCTASSAEMCTPQTMALTMCIANYCNTHPGGMGCPSGGPDAGTGGGGS